MISAAPVFKHDISLPLIAEDVEDDTPEKIAKLKAEKASEGLICPKFKTNAQNLKLWNYKPVNEVKSTCVSCFPFLLGKKIFSLFTLLTFYRLKEQFGTLTRIR